MAICQCLYLYLDEFGGEPFPMMDCNGTSIIFEGFPGKSLFRDVFFIVLDWIFAVAIDLEVSAKGSMVDSLVDSIFVDSIMLKRDLKRDYIT